MDELFIKELINEIFGGEPSAIYIAELDLGSEIYVQFVDGSKAEYNYEIDICSGVFCGHRWKISCGASKLVIIVNGFNEVIKIPFFGEYYYKSPEDMSTTEDDYDCYDDYYWATFQTCSFDNHIEIEENIYRNSSSTIKELLLPNHFHFWYGGVPVYTQSKIEVIYEDRYSWSSSHDKWLTYSEQEKAAVKSKISSRSKDLSDYLPDLNFLKEIMDFYGVENGGHMIENMDFCDMNRSNYGYMSDGRPVIIDYAGYHG